MPTVLVVHLDIRPDQLDRFVEIVTKHGAYSVDNEAGCLGFQALRCKEQGMENRVILVETYADPAALQAHWESDHMDAYRRRTADMILERQRFECSAV